MFSFFPSVFDVPMKVTVSTLSKLLAPNQRINTTNRVEDVETKNDNNNSKIKKNRINNERFATHLIKQFVEFHVNFNVTFYFPSSFSVTSLRLLLVFIFTFCILIDSTWSSHSFYFCFNLTWSSTVYTFEISFDSCSRNRESVRPQLREYPCS